MAKIDSKMTQKSPKNNKSSQKWPKNDLKWPKNAHQLKKIAQIYLPHLPLFASLGTSMDELRRCTRQCCRRLSTSKTIKVLLCRAVMYSKANAQ